MIINKVKNLVVLHQITPYELAKRAGITHSNIRELMKDETVVPRKKALNGICAALRVTVNDVLKFEPNRVSTKSNRTMNNSRLSQNYFTNNDYNILDVQQRLREQQEQMMVY